VVALIEQARAACAETRRLQAEERRLRGELRALAYRQHLSVLVAVGWAARTIEAQRQPLPSPWTSLWWRRPGRDLDEVLLPLD